MLLNIPDHNLEDLSVFPQMTSPDRDAHIKRLLSDFQGFMDHISRVTRAPLISQHF
jgi:hypothetical protein